MEKRTVGIVATVIAVLLCGCPGLLALCWGGIAAIVSFVPNANINMGGSSDPKVALMTGLATCCGGIIFIGGALLLALVCAITVGWMAAAMATAAATEQSSSPPR